MPRSFGADNALWYQHETNGTRQSGYQSLGGYITSAPALESDASGLSVYVEGADTGLWYQYEIGGTWTSGWTGLGGTLTARPGSGDRLAAALGEIAAGEGTS
jgi:hypothetical protein